MNIKKLAFTALTCASLATVCVVQADGGGPFETAIEARQGMFELYSVNMGLLSGMAKGKVDYDADLATEAANNLQALANLGQSQLWPAGSDSEALGKDETRALVAIWDTYPKVVEKFDALKSAVDALVPVAGSGLDGLKGAMGDVGGSCKSCHDDFRAEKD